MKRLRKFLIYQLIMGLISAGIFLFYVSHLPSPGQIAKILGVHPAPSVIPVAVSPVQAPQASPNPVSSNPAASSTASADLHENTVTQYMVNRYLSEDASAVAVCQHLDAARDRTDSNRDSMMDEFVQVATEKKSGDPYVESVMAPIGYALRRPSVQALIHSIVEARDKGDAGFLNKAAFYSKLALAGADLAVSRHDIERVSDRAYILYHFTRALRENPRFIGDPAVLAVCESLQKGVLDPHSEVEGARATMNLFLQEAGVTPESIGYDPDYRSHLEYSTTKAGLQIHIPWIDQIFIPSTPDQTGS